MLNKKLVIAALLAAAVVAEDEVVADEAADTPADGADDAADDTPADGADGADGADDAADDDAADGADDAADDGAGGDGGDGDGDGPGGDGSGDDEKHEMDFEKARKDWKEVLADGTERVLCDQGESALWEEAQDHWEELVKELAEAEQEVADQKQNFDDLTEAARLATEAKEAHKNDNQAYLDAWTAANDEVNRLVAATGGSDTSTAAQGVVDGLVQLTRNAELAFDAQRTNVENLVKAKRTQDQEEALWAERVTAANTAQQAANQAKLDADADVATAEEQVTTRSWLLKTLNWFDSDAFADNCDTVANGLCAITETTTGTGSVDEDANNSLWAWPASGNCDYNDGTAKLCPILGISGASAGLVQSATAAAGSARVTTVGSEAAPTKLYLAYETADYTYVSSCTQLDGADSSKLLIALDVYEKWQKKLLMAEMMKTACWTLEADGTTDFVAGDDKSSWCHLTNTNITGTEKFHPLVNGITNTRSYVAIDAEATTLKGSPAFGEASSQAILLAQQQARAAAQVNLWYNGFGATALDAEWQSVGKEANRSQEVSDDSWKTRVIGAAEVIQTSKATMLAAADKNLATAEEWKRQATADVAQADDDLEKAQTLLADLVKEIAPLARDEIEARNVLVAAIEANAARAVATQQLGEDAVFDNSDPPVETSAATGARAVLAAATATKESVEAQQAFHDARAQWAADNLAPVAEEYNSSVDKVNELTAARDIALALFDAAREQCKRAAFEHAQEAREKAQEIAAAVADKQAQVAKDYGALSAFATEGQAGALCNYPKVGPDEAQQPRPECAEGEPGKPLCCGAAQRFLKDGTKLSIETCQLATDTTYTYWPALPADALVAPTSETWRFQCISAAQKLAAAATAALAAGYMMA